MWSSGHVRDHWGASGLKSLHLKGIVQINAHQYKSGVIILGDSRPDDSPMTKDARRGLPFAKSDVTELIPM